MEILNDPMVFRICNIRMPKGLYQDEKAKIFVAERAMEVEEGWSWEARRGDGEGTRLFVDATGREVVTSRQARLHWRQVRPRE